MVGTGGCGRKESRMLPLYEDPHFTFRFADDRLIPRFHLEGVPRSLPFRSGCQRPDATRLASG